MRRFLQNEFSMGQQIIIHFISLARENKMSKSDTFPLRRLDKILNLMRQNTPGEKDRLTVLLGRLFILKLSARSCNFSGVRSFACQTGLHQKENAYSHKILKFNSKFKNGSYLAKGTTI